MPTKKIEFSTIDAYGVYMAITETEKVNKSLPYKLAWALDDVKAIFKIQAIRYETERAKIFEKLGTKEGEGYTFPKEVVEELNKAIKDLGEVKVELEFASIPSSLLDTVKDLQFAAGAFEVLRKDIIEFPKKTEEKEEKKKEKEIEDN